MVLWVNNLANSYGGRAELTTKVVENIKCTLYVLQRNNIPYLQIHLYYGCKYNIYLLAVLN